MAASIIGTSEMAVGEMEQGGFREVIVESDEGTVLGIGAGEEAILVVLVRRDANLGLILLNMKKCAAGLKDFFESDEGTGMLVAMSGG